MDLPPELWLYICNNYLDLPDIKKCRLLNKSIGSVATAIVFETVYFSFTEKGLQTLEGVSARAEVANNIKIITLQQGSKRGYPAFSSRESWEKSLRWPDKISSNDARRGEHAITSEKWENMTSADKESLYKEYEKDRTTLRSHRDDVLERVVQSLKKMPNLSTFWHKPTKYDEMDWKCEWRGSRFPEDDDDDFDDEIWAYAEEIEHDIDSLLFALVLQALGSVPSLESLETISFETYGPSFWTQARLRHLWEGFGHGEIRRLRETHQDAATADRILDDDADNTVKEDCLTTLDILKNIISHVECIDLNVVESYSNGSLDTIAEPLSKFLRLGQNLRDVTLAFGNFHPYFDREKNYQELRGYPEKKQGLLAQLAIGTPWPAIVTLHITIATTSSTLLDFLGAIAPTLRTLWLDSVILLPGDSKEATWEYVLASVAKSFPKIERLSLDNLIDFRKDGSTRKLFHFSVREMCEDCYKEHQNKIVEDLLCRRKLQHALELDVSSGCEHQ